MDELILLPEAQAAQAYFDDLNRDLLFRMVGVLSAAALFGFLALVVEGSYHLLVVPVITLVMVRLLYGLRESDFLQSNFRVTLGCYLLLQLPLLKLIWLDPGEFYHPADLVLYVPLLLFRLTTVQMVPALAVLWLATAGRDLLAMARSDEHVLDLEQLVIHTAVAVVVFAVSRTMNHRVLVEFLGRWRLEHQRHRERLRMREELDQARRLQLSMLPRSDPSSTWLDLAGISIPASEVGGDYYEYFQVDDMRQAVVVADVAGHGVASGLLLATVRGCLYLLKESPQSPSQVLGKIDRVVRETTHKRTFVTMLYALFDRDRQVVRVACAGHPPLVRYVAATGEVEELGAHSLPLGTALQQEVRELESPFRRDDIFLAYTDGIAETVSGTGKVYGTERLAEKLRRTDHDRSAREIRDTLLGDVWNFKADGEQNDDITLVVVKIL